MWLARRSPFAHLLVAHPLPGQPFAQPSSSTIGDRARCAFSGPPAPPADERHLARAAQPASGVRRQQLNSNRPAGVHIYQSNWRVRVSSNCSGCGTVEASSVAARQPADCLRTSRRPPELHLPLRQSVWSFAKAPISDGGRAAVCGRMPVGRAGPDASTRRSDLLLVIGVITGRARPNVGGGCAIMRGRSAAMTLSKSSSSAASTSAAPRLGTSSESGRSSTSEYGRNTPPLATC